RDRAASFASSCALCAFYCPLCHRDLPSFPTRRSSDLRLRALGALFPHELEQVVDGNVLIGAQPWIQASDHDQGAGEARHRFGRGDRKSTRLNSSHVKISYAVFCLKKKNNGPDDETAEA